MCVVVSALVWSGLYSDLSRASCGTHAPAALSGSDAWSVYVVLPCIVCSVWRIRTIVIARRRLLEDLQILMLDTRVDAPNVMNEMEYLYMKDLVRCGLNTRLSFAFSWRAFLFDGTMPRSLMNGEPMTLRLRRCRRSCGPCGWSASIVAGARFCGGLLSLVG